MYDGRLRLCNQVVSEVRKHFEDIVFNTIIHRNSKLSEAPSVGKPLFYMMPIVKALSIILILPKKFCRKII
jgi:chromosome partitioning protein